MPGTPKVGYMGPDKGPFRCGSCKHWEVTGKGSGCNQKEVIAELGAGKAGLAAVDENGCCNEFEPQKRENPTAGVPGGFLAVVKNRKAKK